MPGFGVKTNARLNLPWRKFAVPMARFAWLPLLMLATAAPVLCVLEPQWHYPARYLLLVLNLIFLTGIGVAVAALAGRTYARNGCEQILLLGSGILVLALAGVFACLLILVEQINAGVACYNLGAWLASCLHLGSVFAIPGSVLTQWRLHRRSWLLDSVYGACATASLLLLFLVLQPWFPVFMIPGVGPTPLRQVVLSLAVFQFGLAAVLLKLRNRGLEPVFARWYTLGLGLITLGLFYVALPADLDTVTSWLGRGSQYLGGLYILIGIIASRHQQQASALPLAAALSENEQRYHILAETSFEGIAFSDAGKIVECNQQFCQIVGRTQTQLQNMPLRDLVVPEDAPRLEHNLRQPESSTPMRCTLLRPDGSRRVVEVHGKFMVANTILYRITVMRDVTQWHNAETELRRLNSMLEQRIAERTAEVCAQADQLRSLANQLVNAEQLERKRLAKILHDHIQQNLVAARMQAELLKRSPAAATVSTTADTIISVLKDTISQTRSLAVDLFPPVLHESGLQAGLQWLATRLYDQYQFTVKLQADAQAEPACESMRLLLFECVRELLLNAVKHSGVNQACVSVLRGRDNSLRLQVRDEGRGFDPDVIRNRRFDEVTFGLFSIEQRLAHLGGRIEFETAPGKGTCIELTVPAELRPLPAHADAAARQNDTGSRLRFQHKSKLCRVLIVDDHAIMREGLAGILQFEPGIEVVGEAADGETAIALAAELQPDAIIMDVNLGGLSGVEATRRISAAHPHIRVIGLSMHSEEGIAIAMRKAGASAYLTKGGPAEDLINALLAETRPAAAKTANISH